MSVLVRRTQTCIPRDDVLTALFHSSTKREWKKKKLTALRGVEDIPNAAPQSPNLNASTSTPRKRELFVRDTVPHTNAEHAEDTERTSGRNPSFRRRTQESSERDWTRRTGKWSASRFGGGDRRGSQMGLTEDRPQSYGLGRGEPEPSAQTRREDFAPDHANREGPARERPSSQRRDEGDRVWNSSPAPPRRTFEEERGLPQARALPRKSSFGLRSLDDEAPRGSSATADRAWTPPPPSPASSSTIGSQSPRRRESGLYAGADDPELDRFRPAWAESSTRRSQEPPKRIPYGNQNSRDDSTVDMRLIEDEVDSLVRPSSLKNRRQPPPAPPVPKSPPAAPPPKPKPPRKAPVEHEKSLFAYDAVVLGRNNVPIVTKADPVTAATTSAYSPRMDLGNDLPTKFTSPPLLPGLVTCVLNVLDSLATPTKIQALSLKFLVDPWTSGQENSPDDSSEAVSAVARRPQQFYKEYLLASETGSGKSIAYLLPMLQALKLSEARRLAENTLSPIASKRGLNPRALVLAPTHELARQLSATAKALVHDVKLRVLCASRRNLPTRPAAEERAAAGKGRNSSAGRMKALMSFANDGALGEFEVKATDGGPSAFPVDVVVGTPMKLMEMVRGRGWEREVEFAGGPAAIYEMERREQSKQGEVPEDAIGKEKGPKRRRGRDSVPGVGEWRSSPEMGLSEVEWVIVDEADVLFDSDFQETTRMLLADIAKARGHEVPFITLPIGLLAPMPPQAEPVSLASRVKAKAKTVEENEKQGEEVQTKIVAKRPSVITPLNYPFNFLLTSASVPNWLSKYLNAYHPTLRRLVSPDLHHLPKSLKTEWVNWSGGNKSADIERRLRKVWAADAADGLGPGPESLGDMSKVLIFCNKNSHVENLGTFLEEKGIKNIPLSAKSDNRKRGNNKHLEGFIRVPGRKTTEQPLNDWSSSWIADQDADEDVPAPVKKVSPAPRALVPIVKQGEQPTTVKNDPMNVPHVMITTSFLSRGLDFSPNVKHVFIVDDPRSMVDFLHRAGRTGRAGENGKVVIFGKMEGRGSQQTQKIKKQVKALVA
ncbi:hypothetical protein C8R46DRAFT_1174177 [Mycena filopes]|nr:hypothetical protein C8R46DRAFT_1174177 [Mycena filopes]